MKQYSALLAAVASLAAAALASADGAGSTRADDAIGAAFIMHLTAPRTGSSHVSVVDATLGSSMLISRDAQTLEYVRGATFLWMQAAEQLERTRRKGPFEFRIARWTLTEPACPGMMAKVNALLDELDRTLAGASGVPAPTPPPDLEEIVLDAPTYLISTPREGAMLTLRPDGSRSPQLQQAASALHSTVSGCSNSEKPQLERHEF